MEAHAFTAEDMGEPRRLRVGGGEAVVLSRRCPGGSGPNQDAAAVVSVGAYRGVLLVADGLGGRPEGAAAAARAVRCLQEALRAAGSAEDLRGAILDGVEAANQAVMELGVGAGTTLAIAECEGRTLRPYHVGDSAIWVVGQRGRLKLQTISHSPVGYALESGLLDEEEALHHDERHVISNVVGGADMRIEVGSRLPLAARDTVLLGTDGLFDNLAAGEIVEIVRKGPLAGAARSLAQTCARRMSAPAEGRPSKPDDHTFIVFRPG
jgi:serine/threonine protein phosphatase PrpC